jgi:hypothetical protein
MSSSRKLEPLLASLTAKLPNGYAPHPNIQQQHAESERQKRQEQLRQQAMNRQMQDNEIKRWKGVFGPINISPHKCAWCRTRAPNVVFGQCGHLLYCGQCWGIKMGVDFDCCPACFTEIITADVSNNYESARELQKEDKYELSIPQMMQTENKAISLFDKFEPIEKSRAAQSRRSRRLTSIGKTKYFEINILNYEPNSCVHNFLEKYSLGTDIKDSIIDGGAIKEPYKIYFSKDRKNYLILLNTEYSSMNKSNREVLEEKIDEYCNSQIHYGGRRKTRGNKHRRKTRKTRRKHRR